MKDPLSLVEVACDGERKHLVTFVIRAEEISKRDQLSRAAS